MGAVVALPIVHRLHAFVEPTKGEMKWCALCGKTKRPFHPRYERCFCAECGEWYGPGDRGYTACSQHGITR